MTDDGTNTGYELGGEGGLLGSHRKRADLRLLDEALHKRFNLPDEVFRALPAVAAKMMLDKGLKPRTQQGAMRLLVSMARHNLEAASEVGRQQAVDRMTAGDVEAAMAYLAQVAASCARPDQLTSRLRALAQNGNGNGSGNGKGHATDDTPPTG